MACPANVGIYAHVSTNEQSPDGQPRDLREYAANRGWNESAGTAIKSSSWPPINR
jgi:DNA invertase Pin-like site-specific DNA recombinase